MELDLHAIGKRIRTQREYLGYSREKMAEYLNDSGINAYCRKNELNEKTEYILSIEKKSS